MTTELLSDLGDRLDQGVAHDRSEGGDVIFGLDDDTLASVCIDRLRQANWKLAAAESMTGGLIGAALTSVPGSSDVFLGSAVTYASDSKVRILKVDPSIIEQHGPVSSQVTQMMAANSRALFNADVAVAVTGSAGPSAQGDEVGEVFIATDVRGASDVVRLHLSGDRNEVRARATAHALDILRRRLLAGWGR